MLPTNQLGIDEKSEKILPKTDLGEDNQTQDKADSDSLLKKSLKITGETTIMRAKLLAWSSQINNKISVVDLETKQSYANFDGASIGDTNSSWAHVKEIPDTKLLVSLHHDFFRSAKLEIFDISKKGQAHKIYSFEKVSGATGWGDVTYNSKRNILASISVFETEIAYHLFTINTSSKTGDIAKLTQKSR